MRRNRLRVLWFALVGAQLTYLHVPFVAARTGKPAEPGFVWRLTLALAAVSLITAGGTLLYRRRALVSPIQSGHLDPDSTVGAWQTFTVFIVSWVLTTSISIYGLVLALLSQNPTVAFPFALPALGLMYLHGRNGARARATEPAA